MAIVVVTHEMESVRIIADRITMLAPMPGGARVVFQGTYDEMRACHEPVVRDFVAREPLHEPRTEANEILRALVGDEGEFLEDRRSRAVAGSLVDSRRPFTEPAPSRRRSVAPITARARSSRRPSCRLPARAGCARAPDSQWASPVGIEFRPASRGSRLADHRGIESGLRRVPVSVSRCYSRSVVALTFPERHSRS